MSRRPRPLLPTFLAATLPALALFSGLAGAGEGAAAQVYPGYAAFVAGRPPRLPAELEKPLARGRGFLPGYFVVHFRGAPTPADEHWLAEVTAAGRARAGLAPEPWIVPEHARGVWVDEPGTLRALHGAARVDWVGRHQPGYKLDPALVLEELLLDGARLELELVAGHPPEAVRRELAQAGARELGPRARNATTLRVAVPPGALTQVAWIEGIRELRALVDDPELERRAGRARSDGGDSGSGRTALTAPLVLRVTQGWDSDAGTLSASRVARLQASDDQRHTVIDGERLVLAFEPLPEGALAAALRVYVEHHEGSGLDPGDLDWKLGHGSLTSPTIVQSTNAPIRNGRDDERLDVWAPTVLVPDLDDLRLVIENDHRSDDALVDLVYVEVDLLAPAEPPRIFSTPALAATTGQPYLYDADGRAEADGSDPIAWSLVEAPTGFTVEATTGLVRWTPATPGTWTIALRATNEHGEDVQTFSVAVTEDPLGPTLLPAHAPPIVYCPPERLAFGPPKPQQRLNVFLPRGTPPPQGWPVLLNNRGSGGVAAAPLPSLSNTGGTAPLHALVASGVAVVDFGVTAIGNGLGLFHPPGHANGRYESYRPADDNPEKEAEWAVQWLKSQTSFPLDPERICLRGSSQGAIISLWAAMGPERARASGSAQVRASTRVKGIVALHPPTWVWGFVQDPSFYTRMVAHFEQAAQPRVPATHLAQVAREVQEAASIMGFAFESAEAREHNQTQAICLVYNEPVRHLGGTPADLSLDARGLPRLHDALALPYVHDSWAGYVLFARLLGLSEAARAFHLENSVFAIRDTSALPAPNDIHTRLYRGPINGTGATALAHDWILRTLGVSPAGG